MPTPRGRRRAGRGPGAAAALAALAALVLGAAPAHGAEWRDRGVYARVNAGSVVLGNDQIERRWRRAGFRTERMKDKRAGGRTWASPGRDFTLELGSGTIGSDAFDVTSVQVERPSRGGLRVTMELEPAVGGAAGALSATRVAEAYPGVAGVRVQTIVRSPVPLALTAATLDEARAGVVAPFAHALRAGADWRAPGWEGPPVTIGDRHEGTWRRTYSAEAGAALEAPGQWLSLRDGERSLFMVAERNDFPSSRALYEGDRGALRVDYTHDVALFGPFEETVHVESPFSGAGRGRVIRPGVPYALEAAFTGAGSHDGDEPWQFHRYLFEHRLARYPRAVTFNSNGTDADRISTGAKDDMDIATVREVAPIARALGVETFILDDGWQAVSGDWEPDSPQHPEPRWDGVAGSKFAPRFPDDEFRAVREAIAPMRLGLWMSPMHFNPASSTYAAHPDWACTPAGQSLAAYNSLQPDEGSNEAGIGAWGPPAIPHVESRIREAIEEWGVTYFKFDFLAWLDCAGQGDLYDMHDAFVAMIDRLQRDHPRVTFQIDETNDYRLFPFESVARGPSWFQNGTPRPARLLHNMWNLAPYVPAFSLGQHFLGSKAWEDYPVDTLMAAALPSHLTYFSDLRALPEDVIDAAAPWTAFYRRERDALAGVVYPLLADPLENGWTALQSWDPKAGKGMLLAFRQESGESQVKIALRNVRPGRHFDLFRAPTSQYVGTVSSERLRRGLRVELGATNQASVLVIRPSSDRPGLGGSR